MTESSNLATRLGGGLYRRLKSDLATLIYVGPPFYCGWRGTGVIAPIVWWVVVALLAVCSEYRPSPDYDELRSRPIAFGIALVAFVSIYYVARWISPNEDSRKKPLLFSKPATKGQTRPAPRFRYWLLYGKGPVPRFPELSLDDK